jgi:hypothetical protein
MTTKLVFVAPAALLVALVAVMALDGRASAGGTALGIDADPTGNTALQLGAIQDCREVEVSDTFQVDVYIQEVTDLQAWEFFLESTGSILTVTAHNSQMFLGGFESADIPPDNSGSYFIGVGSQSKNTGSGVLARVTFHADAPGLAVLGFEGERLQSGGQVIQTDGGVHGALIAVGVSCQSATFPPTPVNTPIPTNSPTPSPDPSPTPRPSATPEPTPPPTLPPTPTPTAGSPTARPTLPPIFTPTPGVPTPSPTPGEPNDRDADCDTDLDGNDILRVLSFLAGVADPAPACPSIGSNTAGAVRGDGNCDGDVTQEDALALLHEWSTGNPDPGCLS